MSDTPRIEELKRRVQVDPASIAFAALAEEYRRAGRFDEAIATCQAGLQRHPAYLSAHVTLGRALLELGRFDEAREELAHVLRAAPENLAAIRGLAEIHHRRGELPEALEQYRSALQVAKHDAELEQRVDQIARQVLPADAAAPVGLSSDPAPVDPVHADPAPARQSGSRDDAAGGVPPAPDPPPRPHLELVMRHPRAPEPESEPASQPAQPGPESDAARPGSELPVTEPGREPQVAQAEPEFHAAFEALPPVAAEPAPDALAAEAAPDALAAAEHETVAWEPPSEPAAERRDPALSALEGFLAAIVREKAALVATSADRR